MASKHLDQLRRIAAYMPTIKTLREPCPVGRRQDGVIFARPYDYDEHDMVAITQYVAALEDMAAATMRVREAQHQYDHRASPTDALTGFAMLSSAVAALDAALAKLKELS